MKGWSKRARLTPERSTPRFRKLLEQIRELRLPADSFAVFGSGPMAAVGLRDVLDLDVIVTPELWRDLASKHHVTELADGGHRIVLGEIEIFDSWAPPMGDLTTLIEEAKVIDGIRFVKLETVQKWKQRRDDPKDADDLRLLEECLRESG